MQNRGDFSLNLPSHIKSTLSNLSSFKNEVDLVICVVDARASKVTDILYKLKEVFPKSRFLSLISKGDLVPFSLPNAFNFKDQSNRKKILDLIKKSLGKEREQFERSGYISHYQIFIVGFPNVGKSTLINLLKGRKVSDNKNYPGVTRKIVKYYLGDNLWLYDSPGIFVSTKLSQESLDKLFLINSIPSTISSYSNLLERAYFYLSKNYLGELKNLVREEFCDYSSFILSLAKKHNCKARGGSWDLSVTEEKFLRIIRSGKLKISWDLE